MNLLLSLRLCVSVVSVFENHFYIVPSLQSALRADKASVLCLCLRTVRAKGEHIF